MPANPPNNYRMSDVVNKLLSPALTSQYQVDIVLPDAVKKFVESSGRLTGAYNQELVTLSCSEASLPGSSLATHEITNDRPGVSEKMAYRRVYDDRLDLTFYVDNNYEIIEVFEGWMNYVVGEGSAGGGAGFTREAYRNSTSFYRMNYPEFYKSSEFYVNKFERDYSAGGKQLTYQFIDAFPISITSMPISYDTSQLLKCTVSFSYTRFVRSTITSSPSSSASTIISGLPGLGPTPPGVPLPGTPTGGGTVAGGGVIV